jgi:outer membrane protein TolC
MLSRIPRGAAGLAVILVMASTRPTLADTGAAPAALDEATFLRRVAERSPRRAALRERGRAADAAVAVAGVRPNPRLGYEREAVRDPDVSEDFIRLGYALDLAGRRGLAIDAARAAAAAERAAAERELAAADIDARLAYLEAAFARARLGELDRSRSSLAGLVEALRSRAAQGDASEYDAERAALELDLLEDERATAARELELARLRLGALLGEPATRYDAADPLVVPARPTDAGVVPARPELVAAGARIRQAEREATAAGRGWIPRLELTVGVVIARGPEAEGTGYIVGIAGELPVLDAGGAAQRRARAEARRWRAEAAAVAVEVAAEVAQARADLVERIEHAERFREGPAVRAADLARRAAVAYREGDRTIIELLDVERAARTATVRLLGTIYEARRAALALERATGRTP